MEQLAWHESVEKKFTPRKMENPVAITVIVPVYNSSEKLTATLESIKRQSYAPLEVIVIDAMSSDHSVEIARSFSPLVSRIYTVTEFNLFEMINRGIALSSGKYITTLLPGSFYLSDFCFDKIATVAFEKKYPDLLYFGSIQHERALPPKQVFYPLSLKFLEKALLPATLVACFFEADLFEKVGKFRSTLTQRALLDLFFRIGRSKELKVTPIDRVYVDFDKTDFSLAQAAVFAKETGTTLATYMGFWKAFKWIFANGPIHMGRFLLESIKKCFYKA